MAGGWVKTTVLFFAVCGPKFTRLRQQTRERSYSLQRRFPIVDILYRSGDIRDLSAKSSEIAPKSMFFGPKFCGGGPPNFGPSQSARATNPPVGSQCPRSPLPFIINTQRES